MRQEINKPKKHLSIQIQTREKKSQQNVSTL